MSSDSPAIGSNPGLEVRLYVVPGTANSNIAEANLRAACERCGLSLTGLEVVDVTRDPNRAMNDGVLVTPTLVRKLIQRQTVMIGRLEPPEVVDRFLMRG